MKVSDSDFSGVTSTDPVNYISGKTDNIVFDNLTINGKKVE